MQHPFTIAIEKNDDFRIENQQSGFEISGDDDLEQFFIAFDLALWFDSVDLDAAVVDSGSILIDRDNNEDLHDQILLNIKLSSRLFIDLDEDGELEIDELDDDLVLGVGEDD